VGRRPAGPAVQQSRPTFVGYGWRRFVCDDVSIAGAREIDGCLTEREHRARHLTKDRWRGCPHGGD